MVKILTNPIILRGLLLFVSAAAAFLIGMWTIRSFRRRIFAEAELNLGAAPSLEGLPLHLYNTVIQQLKQQKHELQLQTQSEQRRARTSENFSQAVLSNLSLGVLVFGVNGLVKQANPAAKAILGYNAPSGMSADDIFRGAVVCSNSPATSALGENFNKLSDEVAAVLREGSKARQAEADYTSPTGRTLRIAVTVSPVPAIDGSLLGAACLIADRSEFEQIRQQQQLHGEISAEMALELRTSLTMIAGYAQQLANNRNAEADPQLAEDIADEAARLDRHIGGFLASRFSTQEVSAKPVSTKKALPTPFASAGRG